MPHAAPFRPREKVLAYIANVVPYSQTNPEELAAVRAWDHTCAVPAGLCAEAIAPQHTDSRRIVIT